LFFVLGVAVSVLWLVAWFRFARRTVALSSHTVGRQRILGQQRILLKDLQAIRVLEHFHVVSATTGHPVVVGAKGGIAILVRAAVVRLIGAGRYGGSSFR
jgi:hypothetical protein